MPILTHKKESKKYPHFCDVCALRDKWKSEERYATHNITLAHSFIAHLCDRHLAEFKRDIWRLYARELD